MIILPELGLPGAEGEFDSNTIETEPAHTKARQAPQQNTQMSIESINPATGELVKTYPEYSSEDVDRIIRSCDRAQQAWKVRSFQDRARLMRSAGQVLLDRIEHLAGLMATEMGKPLRQGRAEVKKCAWGCEYYADHAESFLADEHIESDASESFVTYRPLGIVLAIMPWNFPLWQVIRFAAPTLMAGNAALLKHASNVAGCSLAIEQVFVDAGFPKELFRSLLISSQAVGTVIEHPLVRAVSLTGSTSTGREVAKKAGSLLKKTVLELGGSDPYLVLEDADLNEAIGICVESRLTNSGQSCIAAKRFVVPRSILSNFEQLFVTEMTARKMGDPFDDATDVGPQARRDLRDELHRQVQRSVDAGARCLCGGYIPEGDGAYYPPTVLTDVAPGMPAYDEEIFGPVASIIPVDNEDEAIQVANDSNFGLGAAVITSDLSKGRIIAATRLQAGACFVNAYVKSDPRLPFGGIKESGYGRELARNGILEFVNTKTVYIR